LNLKLKDITFIQSGIYTKPGFEGEVASLQVKHIGDGILKNIAPDTILTEQLQRHLLVDGDIVLVTKGSRNVAAVYYNQNGLCIASSTFMVIRIKPDEQKNILSEFLVWFINNPETQNWLKSNAFGSGVPSISKTTLLEMDIYVPSIEKQKLIVKINELRKLEKKIQSQIFQLKEVYIEQLLIKTLK
jgi:restriction endonuclease S subunit